MIPINKSLDTITTGFTVFEADQVLTHDQLNSLGNYADDQVRLTRTKLAGVGLACGLNPTLNGTQVKVSKGVGVSTDGDLIYLNADTTFTHYKVYNNTYPAYPPFYVGGNTAGTMYAVFELLTNGTDPAAISLTAFKANTTIDLNATFAVGLMESYLKDDDICSGTDCDNLGKEAKNRIKFLLVEQACANALVELVNTPADAFLNMSVLTVERPIVTSSVTTAAQLASLYRATCTNINTSLTAALSGIYAQCSSFIADIFPSDPYSGWNTKLNTIKSGFASSDVKIQYYYDFLKDLAETYNAFRDLLFGDNVWCSPDATSFPKHLLLGDMLTPGVQLTEYRTAFYPSPVVCCNGGTLDRAKFLLKKLDAMIYTFDPTQSTPDIKITPSRFEDASLEDRAIPYYYIPNDTRKLYQNWNYGLFWRRMGANNLSYNAAAYSGPTSPLNYQLGRYSFFRIEGHLGLNATTAVNNIKTLIKTKNLPFAVMAVHAGTSRAAVSVKPAIRYNDLHRLHYVMRQDLVAQLDDVATFSVALKGQVDAEPTTVSIDTECGCAPRTYAATAVTTVGNNVTATRAKLNRDYTTYVADTSWQDSMKSTLTSAGTYRATLGSVSRMEFVTPVDSLIASPHVSWLATLDNVIKAKEDTEDDRLLIGNFIDRNPASEHFAGVVRGGTFVVVYDNTNTVVADFMVPYYVFEADSTVSEPGLTRPSVKETYVINNGVKVLPSRTNFVTAKLDANNTAVWATVDNKLALQTNNLNNQVALVDQRVSGFTGFQNQYVSLFQDSITMLGATVPNGLQKNMATYAELGVTQGDDLTAAAQNIANQQAAQTAATQNVAAATQNVANATTTGSANITAATQGVGTAVTAGTGNIATATQGVGTAVTAGTGNIATATQNVATQTGSVATQVGNVATKTGDVAAQVGSVATQTGNVATNVNTVATQVGAVATQTGGVASATQSVANATQNVSDTVQNVIAGADGLTQAVRTIDTGGGAVTTIQYVQMKLDEIKANARKIDVIKSQLDLDTITQAMRDRYNQDEDQAEDDLGNAVCDVIEYYIDTNTPIDAAVDGAILDVLTLNIVKITDDSARITTRDRLNTLKTRTPDGSIISQIDNLLSLI